MCIVARPFSYKLLSSTKTLSKALQRNLVMIEISGIERIMFGTEYPKRMGIQLCHNRNKWTTSLGLSETKKIEWLEISIKLLKFLMNQAMSTWPNKNYEVTTKEISVDSKENSIEKLFIQWNKIELSKKVYLCVVDWNWRFVVTSALTIFHIDVSAPSLFAKKERVLKSLGSLTNANKANLVLRYGAVRHL